VKLDIKVWAGLGLLAAALLLLSKKKYKSALVVGDSLSSLPNAMGGEMQRILNEKGIPTERVFKSGKGTIYYIGEEAGVGRAITGKGKPGRKVRPSPITQAVKKHRPELLVVILGANDFRLGLAEGDWRPHGLRRKGPIAPRAAMYKAALKKFVNMAEAEGVKKIVWVGPSKHEDDPRPGREHKHGTWSNPAAIQIAKWQKETLPRRVTFIDSQPLTAALPTKDGIHFYPKESKIWAELAAEQLFNVVAAA
tara:strand:- start:1047 stop:1799 length:753 start_codon:yes stop_codon:yes gene_type:complete